MQGEGGSRRFSIYRLLTNVKLKSKKQKRLMSIKQGTR